ncbi:MAG TPA: dephospho-CoA kinase [Opitutus sp.]|nr:dephospho-CoA kinase [Opitutus sp.]
MMVLGIVGGIASGKSLVSREFARLGAEIIDADRLGHEVLLDSEVEASARARWGNSIFGPDGHIDRRQLAKIVFAPGSHGVEERRYLEQLTHPRIASKMRERIGELATLGAVDVVVLDAALLLEAGWDEYCDEILFIDTPRELRIERARSRGWSEADLAAREAVQASLETKQKRATAVINNAGRPEQTIAQVHQYWKTLTAME